MRKEILDAVDEDAQRLDQMYFDLGDVLDVKASIVLVLVTVLGAVSGQILSIHNLSLTMKTIQFLIIIGLGIASVLTLAALWIRKFDAPPPPDAWKTSLSEWEKHYAEYEDAEELLLEYFQEIREDLTAQRIKENSAIIRRKSNLNKWALRTTALALALELVTLASLAIAAYRF